MTKNIAATSWGPFTAVGGSGDFESSEPDGPSEAWQLPAGNFEPTYVTAEMIYPRPDSETPVWAKHRRHLHWRKYIPRTNSPIITQLF